MQHVNYYLILEHYEQYLCPILNAYKDRKISYHQAKHHLLKLNSRIIIKNNILPGDLKTTEYLKLHWSPTN